jgi:hypothetical protein
MKTTTKNIPIRIAVELIILFLILVYYLFFQENAENKLLNLIYKQDLSNITGFNPTNRTINEPEELVEDPICKKAEFIPIVPTNYYPKSDNLQDNLWDTLGMIYECPLKYYSLREQTEKINLIKNEMKKLTPEEIKTSGIKSGNISELNIDTDTMININAKLISFITSEKLFSDEILMKCNQLTFSYYKRNGDFICYENLLMKGVDSKSFTIYNDIFAFDKNNIFFSGYPASGAKPDPLTFRRLWGAGFEFAVDKDRTYFMQNSYAGRGVHFTDITESINPKSIELFDYYIIKDDEHVYLYYPKTKINVPVEERYGVELENIKKADPKTFVELGLGYFKDKNNIYFVYSEPYSRGLPRNSIKKVSEADVDTFRVIKGGSFTFAEDENHSYSNGEIFE